MPQKEIRQLIHENNLKKALAYLDNDSDQNLQKLMSLMDKISPPGLFTGQRESFRKAIKEKNNWYDLIMRVFEIDSGIRKAALENLIVNATLKGGVTQKELSKKYDCNIPWAILMDPTSACNMKCKGCWASEYGEWRNLSFEMMDSVIRQGKEMGTYIYLFTGGEPLIRRGDIIALCEKHQDCMFMAFTNGTLIDKTFCREMLRLKNLLVAVSLEGFRESNDSRRGDGAYKDAMHKMALMKQMNIPFGISTCYTSRNIDEISSEEYYDMLIKNGAFFIWFFHYMPVGSDADVSLLPSPEQREKMYRRVREMREKKPLFAIDFQNDGMYAGGCIAGGRRYLHINANGDIEPCAFIHYADSNVYTTPLLEAYQRPLFMAYHDRQPFNENPFKPCPMLENPEKIQEIIDSVFAVNTDSLHPESIAELCAKTDLYARAWSDTADRLWQDMNAEYSAE